YAGGFLYNPKARAVLLHRRDDKTIFNPNKWAFFGGLNEAGETPKQTFRRELNEELGIEVSEREIKPLCDYFTKEHGIYRYAFFVESDLVKSRMRLDEGAGFEWVLIEKVFEYDLSEKSRKDLKVFLQLINEK
ncbi:MAG: NUDIX domain-containing protein, partial [bacterium]